MDILLLDIDGTLNREAVPFSRSWKDGLEDFMAQVKKEYLVMFLSGWQSSAYSLTWAVPALSFAGDKAAPALLLAQQGHNVIWVDNELFPASHRNLHYLIVTEDTSLEKIYDDVNKIFSKAKEDVLRRKHGQS